MNEKLDKILVDQFPLIFSGRKLGATKSNMAWGFEHEDGWFHILAALCSRIQGRIETINNLHDWIVKYNEMIAAAQKNNWTKFDDFYQARLGSTSNDDKLFILRQRAGILDGTVTFRVVPAQIEQVVAQQVKEKFGKLQFYSTGGDSYIDGMIEMAESISTTTCETCGCPGVMRTKHSWMYVSCDAHIRK